MEIYISNQPTELKLPALLEDHIRRVLGQAALLLNLKDDMEVSILLTDDSTIRNFNLEYRGKDVATDVLSFAMDECGDESEPGVVGGPIEHLLGDIVISIDTAKRQAEEYGHSFEREIGFLLVHGLLHLLGFDHENNPAEEIRMRSEEERILIEMGLNR